MAAISLTKKDNQNTMTVGYQKVLNLPGGFAVQQPLSPRNRTFVNNDILGVIGELSLIASNPPTTRTFHLPVSTQPGQQCAVKSLLSVTGGPVTILGSPDADNGYQQIFYAGIDGQTISDMVLGTYPGECAIFVSGIDSSLPQPNRISWYLVSYNVGDRPAVIPSMFQDVISVNTSMVLQTGVLHLVNMDTAAGDITLTFPVTTNNGAVIGISVVAGNLTKWAGFAGPVDSSVLRHGTPGDYSLFAWSTTLGIWTPISSDVAPGVLETFGSAVGLYRFFNEGAFTDYSGNNRTLLAGIGVNKALAEGIANGHGSLWAGAGSNVARSTDLAFQIRGAVSCIVLVKLFIVPNSTTLPIGCGVPDTAAANAAVWSMIVQSNGTNNFMRAYNSPGFEFISPPILVSAGWYAFGMTRSSGGIYRLYINGKVIGISGVVTLPGAGNGVASEFSVMGNQTGVNTMSASIAQAGVYNTELTPAQMLRASRTLFGSQR